MIKKLKINGNKKYVILMQKIKIISFDDFWNDYNCFTINNLPLDMSKFVGLISRCINRLECKKARPDTISKAYLLIIGSAKGPVKINNII